MARKKIVKPTAAEARRIEGRLQSKYPQMYESAANAREKRAVSGLSSGDRNELLKMVGKKLKAIYRSK